MKPKYSYPLSYHHPPHLFRSAFQIQFPRSSHETFHLVRWLELIPFRGKTLRDYYYCCVVSRISPLGSGLCCGYLNHCLNEFLVRIEAQCINNDELEKNVVQVRWRSPYSLMPLSRVNDLALFGRIVVVLHGLVLPDLSLSTIFASQSTRCSAASH